MREYSPGDKLYYFDDNYDNWVTELILESVGESPSGNTIWRGYASKYKDTTASRGQLDFTLYALDSIETDVNIVLIKFYKFHKENHMSIIREYETKILQAEMSLEDMEDFVDLPELKIKYAEYFV